MDNVGSYAQPVCENCYLRAMHLFGSAACRKESRAADGLQVSLMDYSVGRKASRAADELHVFPCFSLVVQQEGKTHRCLHHSAASAFILAACFLDIFNINQSSHSPTANQCKDEAQTYTFGVAS